MSLNDFLKDKKNHNEQHDDSIKKDFRDKVLLVLSKIKEHSEEKYHELSGLFHSKFNSPNVQRKVIMGFYAQCVAELKSLNPTPVIQTAAKAINKNIKTIKKEVKGQVAASKAQANVVAKAATKQAEKVAEQVKGQVKKQVSETIEAIQSKADALKGPVKKKASVHKKAAKKVTTKVAKPSGTQKRTVKSGSGLSKKKTVKRK